MGRSLREEMEHIERHWGLPPCPKRERLLRILDDMEPEPGAHVRAEAERHGVEDESNA